MSMNENQVTEKKSLRILIGKNADWDKLARECVGMANTRGGTLVVGIEDSANYPTPKQTVALQLVEEVRKRIAHLTINTTVEPKLYVAQNGGEYIEVQVFPSNAISSTTDGRYYYRVADECQPLPPEELMRLLTDKPSFVWETKCVETVPRDMYDREKAERLMRDVRASSRVSDFIKQKDCDDLLDHYLMTDGDCLTQLGVLWVGKRKDRAKLMHAPVVQFLKYDESHERINKIVWDDYSLNPQELITEIWQKIPDWKEGIEVSDGLFRKFISNYDETVIREILANALVHRAYNTRGDIFINLYPDRLEVVNPGRLPLGVTPQNILHRSVRRNDHLAKVFYDLKLMEREGSGYDKIYEVLLSNGKQLPQVIDGDDRVKVLIKKQVAKSEIVSFINRVSAEYQLRQREAICLGLVAQHTTLSAVEIANILNLPSSSSIADWMGRLRELEIIQSRGRTKGVEYFINPQILQKVRFPGRTNLKKIEPYRLRELIYQDVLTYPHSSSSDIHSRIGSEIKIRKIRGLLYEMVEEGVLKTEGELRWRRYSIDDINPHSDN